MYAATKPEERVAVACPPPMTSRDVGSSGMRAKCPGDTGGVAGWNYAGPMQGGKTPSASSVPQQALDAGLYEKPLLSFCWPHKPSTRDCAAAGSEADNYAVFGPALPQGVSPSDLTEVPLVWEPEKASLRGTSKPATSHFFSAITEARVPRYSTPGGPPSGFSVIPSTMDGSDGGKEDGYSLIHWDTGAHGSQMVPKAVLQAYLNWFDAAKPGVKAALASRFRGAGDLAFGVSDAAVVREVCGANAAVTKGRGSAAERWVLTRYTFARSGAAPSKSDVEFVRSTLSSLFPPSVDVVVGRSGDGAGGGVVVSLPGSYVVNECGGGGRKSTTTRSISVCSMYRAGDRYWWAVPWFQGRFVQFDVSAEVQTPARYGVMRHAPLRGGAGTCRF